jgi:uncharacterized membrane protein YccC
VLRPLPPIVSPPAVKQAVRVAVACAAAFTAFKLLGLQQGYWAVFTVLIVMQGSIGGTLAAAFDRMLGTLAGAVLGAIGAWAHDGSTIATGGTLVAVTAVGSYIAVVRPRLKVAPVTASIMMLTMPPGMSIETFVTDRVLEIMLGGVIGVAAMALILPARSETVVTGRAATVLATMRSLAEEMGGAFAGGAAAAFGGPLVALRPSLDAIEQALKEADREHAARLWRHAISPAIPRTLWRVRSDLVLIARALNPPFPEPVRRALGEAGEAMLRALGDGMHACAVALQSGRPVERIDLSAQRRRFTDAFAGFRASPEGNALDLETAGHVFGFSFALDELARDLRDLADRIDEMGQQRPSSW